jgi:hypothetical protein
MVITVDRRYLCEGAPKRRIVSVAVIVAVCVNSDGRRGAWHGHRPFRGRNLLDRLRKLRRRGLRGVKLVISDAPERIKAAVAKVMNATRQRCRVHFVRTCSLIPARSDGASSLPSSLPPSPRMTPRLRKPNGAKSPISCGPRSRNSPP